MITGINTGTGQQFANQNNSTVNKDEFLKLLTYQLRMQNPLRPYDNQEFAAQLAQFSQLEQLTDIRSLMEEQLNLNNTLSQTMVNTALPGMIGKYAKVASENFSYDGENVPEIGYYLPYGMESGTLSIFDQYGSLVRKIDLTGEQLARDEHTIVWDAKNQNGNDVANGNYYFRVDLQDTAGTTYLVDTFISGKIQAVRFKSEGTMLVINGMELSINNVASISMEN